MKTKYSFCYFLWFQEWIDSHFNFLFSFWNQHSVCIPWLIIQMMWVMGFENYFDYRMYNFLSSCAYFSFYFNVLCGSCSLEKSTKLWYKNLPKFILFPCVSIKICEILLQKYANSQLYQKIREPESIYRGSSISYLSVALCCLLHLVSAIYYFSTNHRDDSGHRGYPSGPAR